MSEYDAIPSVDKIWLVLGDLQYHSEAIRGNADPTQQAIRLRRMLTLIAELTTDVQSALAERQSSIGGAS